MKNFIKKETTFVIAGLAAVVSCFFVTPDIEYVKYIDFRVLALLFCLMSAVAGIQKTGLFESLSVKLLSGAGNIRKVSVTLVLLSFFSSMLITNDVALITLVPFAIAVLSKAGANRFIIKVVVLQTVAANLGSMVTPVGNPQNLFLYSYYGVGLGEFFRCIAPYGLLSLLIVAGASVAGKGEDICFSGETQEPVDKKKLAVFVFLFVLSILSVLRIVHFGITTLITILIIFVTDKKILFKNDYFLLATFVFFFIFSGNLGRIEAVRAFLENLLSKDTVFTSAATSQVISNVPAAVLLAPFTNNWRELLVGVNIGGLGTPVASLASLISLKLYMNTNGAKGGRYMAVFLLYNVAGLAVLLVLSYILKCKIY